MVTEYHEENFKKLLRVYLIKIRLMKFQVCYDFISFLILKIVIECPEEILKRLISVTVYFYDNS